VSVPYIPRLVVGFKVVGMDSDKMITKVYLDYMNHD